MHDSDQHMPTDLATAQSTILPLTRCDTRALALHFQFILPNTFASDIAVAVLLLERTLRALRSNMATVGPLLFRMDKLFYTQDLGGSVEADWRESMERCIRRVEIVSNSTSMVRLDRIFVITICGAIGSVIRRLLKHLAKYRRYPLLFAVDVNSLEVAQERVYLHATPIGVLHTDWTLEAAFSCVEYEPDLQLMLARLRVQFRLSKPALREALKVLNGGRRSQN